MADADAALAWTAANIGEFGGDPGRIAVAGHSAGAYIAVTLALDRRWGAADLIKAGIGISGPYDFLPLDTPVTIRTFGQAGDLAATQPVNFVRADAPPLLLLTGEDDKTVLPRHSRTLAARLGEAGAGAELIVYPGINHTDPVKAISRLFRGHAPVLRDVVDFLGRQGLG
jgi:acetyl esterase/lipase